MSSSNSARRSDLLASGAELFLYRTEGKYFPKDCHNNDPGSLIGEFFSWARRWRGTKCPPTFSAEPACGVWSRQRRKCRDDLARKKPAVLRQKRL